MTPNRRVFILQVATASGLMATTRLATAQTMVAETDPVAIGLGYRADATQVDKAKYPKYAQGQSCANCAIYQGAAGSAAGGCSLFAGKQVASKGWCNAWVKKA